MPKNAKKIHRLQVEITPETMAALERAAAAYPRKPEEKPLTVSGWARIALGKVLREGM